MTVQKGNKMLRSKNFLFRKQIRHSDIVADLFFKKPAFTLAEVLHSPITLTLPLRGFSKKGQGKSTKTENCNNFLTYFPTNLLTPKKSAFTLAEVFSTLFAGQRKFAFTLAEVLITLGIIGVVAAMTLPTLMSKYREKVTMTKLKKFYTTMQQAHLRSIADNGEVDSWDWVPSGGESNNEILLNWFNKYWSPYLNNIQIIDRKVLKDDSLVDGGIIFILGDGTVARMSSFSGGYLHVDYYTNYKTFINKTHIVGVDNFLFGFSGSNNQHKCLKRFDAYACTVSSENTLKNNSWGGCYPKQTANGHPYCTRLLQLNGWEAPKDYPYKF